MCLTSHRSARGRSGLWNTIKIWEAYRETLAATTFFDPIAIGRYQEEPVDGATGAKNPLVEQWNEAQSLWGTRAT